VICKRCDFYVLPEDENQHSNDTNCMAALRDQNKELFAQGQELMRIEVELRRELSAAREWLERATTFYLGKGRLGPRDIEAEAQQRHQEDGSIKWGIYEVGVSSRCCLTREGLWEYEPLPSSRDDEYLARARYDSLEDAEAAFLRWQAGEEKNHSTDTS
jgi:hypothetical protein